MRWFICCSPTDECVNVWDRIVTVSSIITSLSMVALCIAGLTQIKKESGALDEYYISVLCIGGIAWAGLLIVAESNWSCFHRFFGILKTRFGKCLSYFMLGTICFMWATEEGYNTKKWPGFATAGVCFFAGMLQFLSVCLLNQKDRERKLWALEGRYNLDTPSRAMPDTV